MGSVFSVFVTVIYYTCLLVAPYCAAISFGEGDFAQGGLNTSATIFSAVFLIRKAIIDHE